MYVYRYTVVCISTHIINLSNIFEKCYCYMFKKKCSNVLTLILMPSLYVYFKFFNKIKLLDVLCSFSIHIKNN